MPVVRASKMVRHCPRCYRAINVGDLIEVLKVDVTGAKRWAHRGCQELVRGKFPGPKARPAPYEPDDEPPEDYTDEAPPNGHVRAVPEDLAGTIRGIVEPMMAELGTELGTTITDEISRNALREITRNVQDRLLGELQAGLGTLRAELEAQVVAIVRDQAPVRVTYEIKTPAAVIPTDEGEVFHPQFKRALLLAVSAKPILLVGPTGCGKTHLPMQLARYVPNPDGTVGRRFGLQPCWLGMSPADLLGVSIPDITTGRNVFHPSDFVRCYEEGGVFCLDEIDAADANILLVVNAAIANGVLAVPRRVENPYAKKHPQFVLVATANTWGLGADRRYCGRNQLDEATLDRFRIGMMECDYSPEIERRLCPDHGLFTLLTAWRRKILEAKLERVMSTRFYRDAFDMVAAGDRLEDIRASFFSGWSETEQAKVLGKPLSQL